MNSKVEQKFTYKELGPKGFYGGEINYMINVVSEYFFQHNLSIVRGINSISGRIDAMI